MNWEILGNLLKKRILNLLSVIAIFGHIFELLWGLPNVFHALGSQSVTSWRRASYHISYERGYPELSYGPNSLNISGVIRELELVKIFRWDNPCITFACVYKAPKNGLYEVARNLLLLLLTSSV